MYAEYYGGNPRSRTFATKTIVKLPVLIRFEDFFKPVRRKVKLYLHTNKASAITNLKLKKSAFDHNPEIGNSISL